MVCPTREADAQEKPIRHRTQSTGAGSPGSAGPSLYVAVSGYRTGQDRAHGGRGARTTTRSPRGWTPAGRSSPSGASASSPSGSAALRSAHGEDDPRPFPPELVSAWPTSSIDPRPSAAEYVDGVFPWLHQPQAVGLGCGPFFMAEAGGAATRCCQWSRQLCQRDDRDVGGSSPCASRPSAPRFPEVDPVSGTHAGRPLPESSPPRKVEVEGRRVAARRARCAMASAGGLRGAVDR